MVVAINRCLLRDILKEKKMTQLALARELNVTEQQINKYVNDRQKMSIEVAKNVSLILSCKIDDLYEWHEVGN